jgi:hypothetical protein
MVYSKKYKSTSDLETWKTEMSDRIIDLTLRLEQQEEELQKYTEYLTIIIRIFRQKMERENTILEDLISTPNNDSIDHLVRHLQEEINILKYKYLEQEEVNKRFFSYMMYK